MTLRCAVYTRVSSDHQAEHGTSLETQQKELRAYAKRQGWRVVKVYEDAGVSGAKSVEQRPALSQLMASARGGAIDVVLVAAWDRLARNLRMQINLWGDLDDLGIEYHSLAEPGESGEDGAMMRQMIAVVAERERLRIRQRTTKGRRAAVESGTWGGGDAAPYGYRVTPGERDEMNRLISKPRMVPDPAEAEIVHRITALMVDERKTTGEVAAILNAEGLMPRRAPKWTPMLMRNHVFRNTDIWAGVWKYAKGSKAGEIVVNLPEPILSASRAEALRLVVKSTATTRATNGIHPLSGRIVCLECGRACTGIMRDGRARRYLCRNSKGQLTGGTATRCPAPSVDGRVLDAAIWQKLRPYLDNPQLLLAEAAGVAKNENSLPSAEATVEKTRSVLAEVTMRGIKMGLDEATIHDMKQSAQRDYDAAVRYRDGVAQQIAAADASSVALAGIARLVETDQMDDPTDETIRHVFTTLDVRVEITSYEPLTVRATGRVELETSVVPGIPARRAR